MKSLVVVDDEILVRVGLRALYDWESAGYRIVGEASSVREALPLIESLRPDIVLTDLVMNPDDGFVLIRRLRELGNPARLVILSCRNDFDAVHRALREGADDYVFKLTMQADEMLEVFARVLARGSETRPAAPGAALPVAESGSLPATQAWLEGGPEALGEVRTELGTAAAWLEGAGRYRLLALSGPSSPVFASLPRLLAELSRRDLPEFLVWNAGPGLLACLLADPGAAGLERLCAAFAEFLFRYAGVNPRIGGSSSYRNAADAPAAWSEAKTALGQGFRDGHSVAWYDQLPPLERLDRAELYALIEAFRWDAVGLNAGPLQASLRSLTARLRGGFGLDESEQLQLIWDCLLPLRERSAGLGADSARLDHLLQAPNLVEAEAVAAAWIEDVVLTIRESEARKYRPEISEAVRWLEDRLGSPVTVEEAARHVHLSPSHFAHTFKDETGVSFLQFVISRRMDWASKLLLTTDLLVYEVAQKVGYENPNHFSTQFRQTKGLSPQELRVQVGRNP